MVGEKIQKIPEKKLNQNQNINVNRHTYVLVAVGVNATQSGIWGYKKQYMV